MRLTKYEHACFTVEKGGKLLVVDPGEYTGDLPPLENVVGIVITHYHADHLDTNALEAIFANNPDMKVFGTGQVEEKLAGKAFSHQAVGAGDTVMVGPFDLEFFGGEHAVIHASRPTDQNVGVMINDVIYYPGDSFSQPERAVKVLALPTAAPWLKIGESIDYVLAVKPVIAFPTHDAVASDIGKNLVDMMMPGFVTSFGGQYIRLQEPLEVDG
jgi:L-ascorbate metabolism protein UlaG (beta-lactamase superfamily)